MAARSYDVQGRFCGFPYDWRMPTLGKLARRVWDPGGSMIRPKAFGWGYTLNLAHRGSWWLIGGLLLAALLFGCASAV